VSEKDNFLCNFERLASEGPGAGKYNPHVEFFIFNNLSTKFPKKNCIRGGTTRRTGSKSTRRRPKMAKNQSFPTWVPTNPTPLLTPPSGRSWRNTT